MIDTECYKELNVFQNEYGAESPDLVDEPPPPPTKQGFFRRLFKRKKVSRCVPARQHFHLMFYVLTNNSRVY